MMAHREWWVVNTMEAPTCYLLRDVSADPFFITTSPVSEAS